MNRKALLIAAVVALVAAAVWWWPTDRRRIIAASRELAEAVSVPLSEAAVARFTRVASLSRLLTKDFRLVDSEGRAVVEGSEAAVGFAARLQPPRGMRVSVGELDLEIDASGDAARARTVVTLHEPGQDNEAESTRSRAVALAWVKQETWQLAELTLDSEDWTNISPE